MRFFGWVQDANLATVYPHAAIKNSLPLLKSKLTSGIQLDLHIEEQTGPVTIDVLQFEFALLNFVIDARDAMSKGGLIKLQLRNENIAATDYVLTPGEYIRVSVAENGFGMSEEVLAKALEPFYTTKSIDKGTGLGFIVLKFKLFWL